jgi:cytochrome c biogenesis protein CcmG/thiol:disulfide interchange protein DsbE
LWLGAGTILLVAVIIAAALLSQSSGSSTAGLTNPNALNPAPNLLPVNKSKAPDFDLATVDGQHYRLSALRGHPVLLEFFAVWCPHCQHEAPILNHIDQAFASQGLRSLSILANPYGRNYDLSGGTDRRLANRGDIAWFQQTFKVAHPMVIDPSFATVNRYGVSGYPTIYVLDRKGVIRSATSGEVPYQQLAAAVAAASQR